MKKTKIVASIGPASNDLDIILEMVQKGVDVFRINLSHISLDECDKIIENVRKAEKKLNKILGIMLDTDGPSIRLDKLIDDEVYLKKDSEIRFYDYHVVCNNTQVSTNSENLSTLVKPGDRLTLSKGEVELEVININKDNFICKVINEGLIKSNQTIHIKDANLHLPFISSKDKESILYAIDKNVDFLALSYVRDEQDVLSVVDLLIENQNDHLSIISKIENEHAFLNLDEIIKVSDGVMVARGDLGLDIPIEKLPYYQKEILKIARNNQKLGLVATDLLKSMVIERTPSRSEVSDIYNLVLDKCDALVLCAETSVGKNPVQVIEVMKNVIEEAEANFDYKTNLDETFKLGKQDVTSTISYSVVDSGILLNASCILANTMSGYTARKISYFRPKSPVLGLSPNINTVRSLTLNYGIIPVLVKKYKETDQIVEECINKYKELFEYHEEDVVIITGGLPIENKNTDFMKIEKIVD